MVPISKSYRVKKLLLYILNRRIFYLVKEMHVQLDKVKQMWYIKLYLAIKIYLSFSLLFIFSQFFFPLLWFHFDLLNYLITFFVFLFLNYVITLVEFCKQCISPFPLYVTFPNFMFICVICIENVEKINNKKKKNCT